MEKGRTAEEEAKIKAEARAYALSGKTNEGSARQRRNSYKVMKLMTTTNTNTNTTTTTTNARNNKRANPNNVEGGLLGTTAVATTTRTGPGAAATATAASTSMSRSTVSAGRPSSSKKARTNPQQMPVPGFPSVQSSSGSSNSSSSASTTMAKTTTTANHATHKVAAAVSPTATTTSQQGHISGSSSSNNNNNNINNNHSNSNNNHGLPIVFDDDDNDYVRMIKSLGLDDFHIFEKLVVENDKDDDDDEEYDFQLSDLDEDDPYLFDDDDDDDDNDNDNDNDNDDEQGQEEDNDKNNGCADGMEDVSEKDSTNEKVVDGKDKKYKAVDATSKTSVHGSIPAHPMTTTTPNSSSSFSADVGSPVTSLPDLESEDAFYRDLEEELGSLLEEDMEAAVQSLYINHHLHHNNNNNINAATSEIDNNMDEPGMSMADHHNMNLSQTQHLIAHASTSVGSKAGPVTAATIAAANKKEIAENKNKASKRSSSKLDDSKQPVWDNDGSAEGPETPLRDAARQGPRAQVSYRQAQQLRKLLQQHYQLLIQQAIMSIRAAQWQKMGFLAAVVNPPANSATPRTEEAGPVTSSGSRDNSSGLTDLASAATTRPDASKVLAKSDFLCGETADDLVEILDGAVGMLQDLDQNRKDAIRTSIQLAMAGGGGGGGGRSSMVGGTTGKRRHRDSEGEGKDDNHNDGDDDTSGSLKGRRSLLSQFSEDHDGLAEGQMKRNQDDRRLTRAAFQLLQAQPIAGSKRTAFDIPGLLKLKETFNTIDRSVNDSTTGTVTGPQDGMGKENSQTDGDASAFSISGGTSIVRNQSTNILQAGTHAEACRNVLKQAGAHVDESLLPGVNDLSDNFSRVQEYLDDSFQPPCDEHQSQFLRKNRNLFTSGEDNLVLRGVNLYGEKQWILIADRYLPDRSVNIISQRYSKLCVMLYKANGIHIDSKGNLLEPPKLESVDDIDENRVQALGLKLVEPPAILNVHRWSLDEDLTLLKAVPIMGHMWAELGARLIPHRDRGHLRKRYQVLERRVKATITRSSRKEPKSSSFPKQQKAAPPRKIVTPAVPAQRPTYVKGSGSAVALIKNGNSNPGRIVPSSSGGSVDKAHSQTLTKVAAKQNARIGTKVDASKEIKTPKTAARATTKRPDPQKESTKAPMSIANAAASLAFMKPMENRMQSNLQSTAAVLSNFRKAPPIPQNEKPALDFAAKSAATPSSLTIDASSDGSMKPLLGTKNPALSWSETFPLSTVQALYPASAPRPYEGVGPRQFQYHYGTQQQFPAQNPHARSWDHHAVTGPQSDKRQQNDASSYTTYAQNAASLVGKHLVGTPPTNKQESGSFLSTAHNADVDSSISPYAASGGVGDASRLAFEKLIDGSSDWSQMSRVRTMMANEDENEVANAIVDYIAKTPHPMNSPTKLTSTFDASSNMSGLSTLSDVLKQDPNLPAYEGASFNRKQNRLESGLSIMAQVLDRTSDMTQNFSEHMNGTEHIPTVAIRSGHSAPEVANDNALSLQTPTRPGGFFSTSGTPTGLSLGFPSPTMALRNEAGSSTYLSIPYSPAPSTFMREFDEKAQTNGILNAFHAEGDSHKEMEVLGRVGEPYEPNPPNLPGTPAKHSLLIAADDFEAVSALEALSNSPFRPSIPANHVTTENLDGKKSLFAKVIGGLNSNTNQKDNNVKRESPKKRLDF